MRDLRHFSVSAGPGTLHLPWGNSVMSMGRFGLPWQTWQKPSCVLGWDSVGKEAERPWGRVTYSRSHRLKSGAESTGSDFGVCPLGLLLCRADRWPSPVSLWEENSSLPCFNLVLILKIIYPGTYSGVSRENMFCHLLLKEPEIHGGLWPLKSAPSVLINQVLQGCVGISADGCADSSCSY